MIQMITQFLILFVCLWCIHRRFFLIGCIALGVFVGNLCHAADSQPIESLTADQQAVFRDSLRVSRIPIAALPRTASAMMSDRADLNLPFRLTQLITGDSYALDLADPLDSQVAIVKGRGGAAGSGAWYALGGGATFTDGDFARNITGRTFNLTASGHRLDFGKGAGSQPVQMWRATVFYSTENGAGNFSLQYTENNGSTWIDVPGATAASPISANNSGAISANSFTYQFASSAPRRIRANWVSGSVRILGMAFTDINGSNANRGGCETFGFDLGGVDLPGPSTTPQGVFNAFLSVFKPHFMVWKSDDSATLLNAYLPTYIQKIQNAWPCDVILVSTHPASSNGGSTSNATLDSKDLALRSLAEANGWTFYDGRSIFPAYPLMQTSSLGLINSDNYHLSPKGNAFLEWHLIRDLSAIIRPAFGIEGNTNSTEHKAPAFFKSGTGVITNGTSGDVPFTIRTPISSQASGSSLFGIRVDSISNKVGINFGPNDYNFMYWSGNKTAFAGGTEGFGNSFPSRSPSGVVEAHGANKTDVPLFSATARTGQTADMIEFRSGATSTSTGTRIGGVLSNGVFDGPNVKLALPTYASNSAADADSSLPAGSFYLISGSRAVSSKP